MIVIVINSANLWAFFGRYENIFQTFGGYEIFLGTISFNFFSTYIGSFLQYIFEDFFIIYLGYENILEIFVCGEGKDFFKFSEKASINSCQHKLAA